MVLVPLPRFSGVFVRLMPRSVENIRAKEIRIIGRTTGTLRAVYTEIRVRFCNDGLAVSFAVGSAGGGGRAARLCLCNRRVVRLAAEAVPAGCTVQFQRRTRIFGRKVADAVWVRQYRNGCTARWRREYRGWMLPETVEDVCSDTRA